MCHSSAGQHSYLNKQPWLRAGFQELPATLRHTGVLALRPRAPLASVPCACGWPTASALTLCTGSDAVTSTVQHRPGLRLRSLMHTCLRPSPRRQADSSVRCGRCSDGNCGQRQERGPHAATRRCPATHLRDHGWAQEAAAVQVQLCKLCCAPDGAVSACVSRLCIEVSGWARASNRLR